MSESYTESNRVVEEVMSASTCDGNYSHKLIIVRVPSSSTTRLRLQGLILLFVARKGATYQKGGHFMYACLLAVLILEIGIMAHEASREGCARKYLWIIY